MPQRTFRVPSASTLDRTLSDPAAEEMTPKLKFSWRKDGKLSKDLSCLLHGKSSTIPDTRTKSREPDITVALFQGLRELTLYEPNLYRVDMEDFKGLEVVLLLAAVAIRDIFFGPAKEAFHIVAGGPTAASGRMQASPRDGQAAPNGKPTPPRLTIPQSQSPAPQTRRRQDELAEEEIRRTQELLAAEKRAQEKARRQREAEVEKETKWLQQIYGKEEQQVRQQKPDLDASLRPHLPPRPGGPSRPYAHQYSQSYTHLPSQGPPQPPNHSRPQHSHGTPVPTFANSPYLHIPGRVDPRSQSTTHLHPRPQSTVGFYQQPTGSGALPAPGQRPSPAQPRKSSFFGFKRSKEERCGNKLEKKRSSMF